MGGCSEQYNFIVNIEVFFANVIVFHVNTL